jgi:antitoxin (DNA-binding transcriptional repressor) of toxin-antitoxin stability system
MKANWSEIERQVSRGEIFEILNRGRPSVRIIPAVPRKVLKWDNHLETALRAGGRTGAEAVNASREGRW